MSSKYQDTWDEDDWRKLQQELKAQEELDQRAQKHKERPNPADKADDGGHSEHFD
jgi:hypothetical protein